jgi:hypothetical protein
MARRVGVATAGAGGSTEDAGAKCYGALVQRNETRELRSPASIQVTQSSLASAHSVPLCEAEAEAETPVPEADPGTISLQLVPSNRATKTLSWMSVLSVQANNTRLVASTMTDDTEPILPMTPAKVWIPEAWSVHAVPSYRVTRGRQAGQSEVSVQATIGWSSASTCTRGAVAPS